ncbi:hypothetical protein RFI_08375 [Reticulomyxa filosa]|uniref:Uncharacterized protein n=1 Tax=Reticulomyxa filosa TaxID=46433 RepID=X6NSL9_RETFI|nr:hypothetical protein RFI_08375 [Reticulomyxa filosa]|eukprot:ETO28754.1 hypothetical protein RFI_08375 [Reticulomyxa filosa]
MQCVCQNKLNLSDYTLSLEELKVAVKSRLQQTSTVNADNPLYLTVMNELAKCSLRLFFLCNDELNGTKKKKKKGKSVNRESSLQTLNSNTSKERKPICVEKKMSSTTTATRLGMMGSKKTIEGKRTVTKSTMPGGLKPCMIMCCMFLGGNGEMDINIGEGKQEPFSFEMDGSDTIGLGINSRSSFLSTCEGADAPIDDFFLKQLDNKDEYAIPLDAFDQDTALDFPVSIHSKDFTSTGPCSCQLSCLASQLLLFFFKSFICAKLQSLNRKYNFLCTTTLHFHNANFTIEIALDMMQFPTIYLPMK